MARRPLYTTFAVGRQIAHEDEETAPSAMAERILSAAFEDRIRHSARKGRERRDSSHDGATAPIRVSRNRSLPAPPVMVA